jgi:hypothetical protein
MKRSMSSLLIREKMKNIALRFLYPASLFFLTFCANKKEHKIVYEQIPLVVSDTAPAEVKNWVKDFKHVYNPNHLDQLVDLILAQEKATSSVQSVSFANANDSSPERENISLVFSNDTENPRLSPSFLKAIGSGHVYSVKSNFEKFVSEKITNEGIHELQYDPSAGNVMDPLLRKKTNSIAYTTLLELLLARTNGRDQLRKQKLFVIFTPKYMSLGFTIKDDAQGYLLFGLSSTNLGNSVKYYGPVHRLKGEIAIVDIEFALMFKLLSPHLLNLKAAREYALDQSAKKNHIDRTRLKENFMTAAPNGFDFVSNDSFEKDLTSVFEMKKLPSVLSVATKDSDLDVAALDASYKAHASLERKKEYDRKQGALAGGDPNAKWRFHFGSWDEAKNRIASLIKQHTDNLQSDPILLSPARKCRPTPSDRDTMLEGTKGLLKDYYVIDRNQAWSYEATEDGLGICTNHVELDRDVEKINVGSKFLQPIYLAFPKNPKGEENVNELDVKTKEQDAVDRIADEFCPQYNMVNLNSVPKLKDSDGLPLLWKELFHKSDDKPELKMKDADKLNFFPIQCINLAKKAEPIAVPDAQKKETDYERNKRARELELFDRQQKQTDDTTQRMLLNQRLGR